MGDWTENFSRKEFACKCCGVGAEEMHLDVVRICQAIRDAIGAPIWVTSGYRCYKHNQEVNGVDNSYHTQGMAVDLVSTRYRSAALWIAARILYARGEIPALGYCLRYAVKDFVHIDIRRQRDPYKITVSDIFHEAF